MNALREIVEVKNHQVIVDLPPNFQPHKVEVIILLETDDDVNVQEPVQAGQKVDYEQYFGISNIGQETIDKQLKYIREK